MTAAGFSLTVTESARTVKMKRTIRTGLKRYGVMTAQGMKAEIL